MDIALQGEPGCGFLRRTPTPQKLLSTLWIENAPLRGMRNKRLSGLPRTRANFVSHNITTAAKKAVAYTKRWIIGSGDSFSQYTQSTLS